MMHQHLPMVALESTVISHGLPYPENLELAQAMEAIVRDHGAEPCTVAILGGELLAGLTYAQLHHLATAPNVRKVSRRDLPIVVGRHADGATTVATTMWIAHRFGIQVFATGGIGGVHRGDGTDVSADLAELAQTPVIVVCAGAKAILDLPATLEYLETHGVTVVGYGTDEFPAFYSRGSGLPVDVRCDTPARGGGHLARQAEAGAAGRAAGDRPRAGRGGNSRGRGGAGHSPGRGGGSSPRPALSRGDALPAAPHRPAHG